MPPVIFKRPSFRFSWYHRDELQIVAVVIFLVFFFSRSTALSVFTLALVVFSVAGLYGFRVIRIILRENTHFSVSATWVREVETRLRFTSPERSRIAMVVLCSTVLGILCIHRIVLALTVARFETPTDVYWILALAWYWVLCTYVLGYLLLRAGNRGGDDRAHSSFFEGLAISLFFYHGLPAKHRVLTFVACFILGGIPTYAATRLHPTGTTDYTLAAALILPVVFLTLGGAWYATRWNTHSVTEEPR